ncbi:hypothetical protein [Tichowtungia aerotolerans]|uniref:Uncharacterized protein n=1 Tax=Tichowtungia aerotolerans TaxID=2697043 RepID=A0A6P1M5B8_9BACT|nr:hypothetical protein [Tichowtungia aerotolerans]QHI69780.1 hypothetical protein GT409_10075 [Tichowtungia aerotolerans]
MRRAVCVFIFLMGMAAWAFAGINYYQGDGANNLFTTAESWSLGVLTENDTVYFSEDGWTVRNEVAATTASGSVGLSHLYFNSNIVNNIRFFSNSDSARLRVAGRIKILEGVAGKVNLDGRWNFRDKDLNIDHYGTNTLEISWIMVETTGTPGADLNYYGNNMNKIIIQSGTAGTGRANYTGRSALSSVDVDLSVEANSTGGGLGLGADLRLNNAILNLIDSGTLSNDMITIAGSLSVFDVSGTTDGSYSYNGVMRGFKGAVAGNLTLTGDLLPGDETGGIGTLTFEDELTIGATCEVGFELAAATNGGFDVVAGGASSTLTVDSGSSWIFDFSDISEEAITNGAAFAVLDGWSTISGSSTNITVSGLPDGYVFGSSTLFTAGFVSVLPVGFEGPAVNLSVAGNRMVMGLDAVAGFSYTIQSTTNLVEGSWSNMMEGVSGNGMIYMTNDILYPQAFFQIVY